MGMNKRECRKYINPGLTISSGSGLLLLERLKHIAIATVKNIAGHRTLIVYFYNRECAAAGQFEPEYTLFQRKDDYITLQSFEGEEKWRTASLERLGEHYAYFTNDTAFYRLSDKQTVTKFCGLQEFSGFNALEALQKSIKEAKLRKRTLARERLIIERMKPVRGIPRGLKNWVHREVLPHYIFYIYKNGKKALSGYCTACLNDVTVVGARHNVAGICPQCKKVITYKASGKSGRIYDRDTVQTIEKINGSELLLRIFKVTNGLHNWRNPKFSLYENARFFIWQDEKKRLTYDAYYYSYNKGISTHWIKGFRPAIRFFRQWFKSEVCGHLYYKNLEEALSDTPWQYSELEQFYRHEREPLEVLPYLKKFNEFPAMEYLVKKNLTNLAAHVVYRSVEPSHINESGRNLREVLGVSPKEVPVLQSVNANALQLNLCQKLYQKGIDVDESLLKWFKELNILSTDDVMAPLEFTSSQKLMRYVNRQHELLKGKKRHGVRRYERPQRILSEYKDYIEMGKMLGYDFSNDFILFPRDLMEAHDQSSTLYDTKKKEAFDKAIQAKYSSLCNQFSYTMGELTIIPPKTADEIVAEGHTLHHCVSAYVERIAKGECAVLFIRETENIEKPFYTVEVDKGRVIQIHGLHHCKPTPEVTKFMEHWKRKKLAAANMPQAA